MSEYVVKEIEGYRAVRYRDDDFFHYALEMQIRNGWYPCIFYDTEEEVLAGLDAIIASGNSGVDWTKERRGGI